MIRPLWLLLLHRDRRCWGSGSFWLLDHYCAVPPRFRCKMEVIVSFVRSRGLDPAHSTAPWPAGHQRQQQGSGRHRCAPSSDRETAPGSRVECRVSVATSFWACALATKLLPTSVGLKDSLSTAKTDVSVDFGFLLWEAPGCEANGSRTYDNSG